jgi:putative transposase
MSLRKVDFVKGEYYHIYSRGNSKQKIFHDKMDYFHFMDLLFLCNDNDRLRYFNCSRHPKEFFKKDRDPLVSIGSFCLISNHFHILITEKHEKGISKFMQKLLTAYVMYYNDKYKRTGCLFEGKFKSQYLKTDKHLKYIFSYIHLNPLNLFQKNWKEKGIKDIKKALGFLRNYFYSSYVDFLGKKRFQNKILDLKSFPKYFPNKKSFNNEIIEWLDYKYYMYA